MRGFCRRILTPVLRLAAAFAICSGVAQAGEPLVPFFSKSFSPDKFIPEGPLPAGFPTGTIGPGSTSTLTFTISNESRFGVRGLRFADKLPDGVVIATPPMVISDCGGTISAPAGGNIIELVDGSVPGNGSCTISVNVTSSVIGTHSNVSEDLISDAGNSGRATADLTVAEELPGFSKSFKPERIELGERSRLTFTIDNSANEGGRRGLTFVDVLPPGLVIADPANVVSDCGGNLTAVPGTRTIRLDPRPTLGPQLAAFEICTISLDVIGTGLGVHHNVSGELTSTAESPGNFDNIPSGFASASIEVVAAGEIQITKSFLDDPVPPGGETRLQFTITNRSRDEVARDISFDDDLEAVLPGLVSVSQVQLDICGDGSRLEGDTRLKFSGGILAPGASCTFSVRLSVPPQARPGSYLNTTSPIESDIGGRPVVGSPATDGLFVAPVPVFTKEWIDDPTIAGGTVTLEYTITNTSVGSEATEIAFVDPIPAGLIVDPIIPDGGFCGPQSVLTVQPQSPSEPAKIIMSGGQLGPRETCSFRLVFDVEPGASTGSVATASEPLTALIGDVTVTSRPARDDLRISAGPQLSKTFVDGAVVPGGTTRLRFTLVHSPEASGPAKNIRFTDDLEAMIPGLVALGLPQNNVCGDGSVVRGDSVITFEGGTLRPGEACSFEVVVRVPPIEPPPGVIRNSGTVYEVIDGSMFSVEGNMSQFAGIPYFIDFGNGTWPIIAAVFCPGDDEEEIPDVTKFTASGPLPPNLRPDTPFDIVSPAPPFVNVTSPVISELDGQQVNSAPATAELRVSNLSFTKEFLDDSYLPGDTAVLEFTIRNDGVTPATNITFTDDLDDVLPGLVSVTQTQTDICGRGSVLEGSSLLSFSGGTVQGRSSCSFQVKVQIPTAAPDGGHRNVSSRMRADIGGSPVVAPRASALLVVNGNLLAIEKTFVRNPVIAGELVGLRFTITNLDQVRAVSDISFSDSLPSGMANVGGTQSDICGPGSVLSGNQTFTLVGGRLAPGTSCTFVVAILVDEGIEGALENVTGEVTGTINGTAVRGDPAGDTLLVMLPPDPGEDGFKITRSELRGDGSFLIEWVGRRGNTYCVQKSTDLQRWVTFGPDHVGQDDTVRLIDPEPPGPRSFYRVILKVPQ